MMGYVGGKVPGHSGTAQKNKKAFARQKQWAKGRSQGERAETQPRKAVGRYELQADDGRFTNWIMLFLVVMLLGAGYWWNQGINESNGDVIKAQVVETAAKGFTEEQRHAYSFLVESGNKNLKLMDYRTASYEFNQALKIAPYGKQARLGLLEVMTELCIGNSYYCDRAEIQLSFVRGMGWLDEG